MTNAEQYANDVISGRILAGIHVRNAVKRFQADLLRTDLVFRQDCVNHVLALIVSLTHFTGKYAGKPFELSPWEEFIVANLYGFYNLDGTRRFQTAYLEMARKQGKTALVAALSLVGLIGEDEAAAEILFAANSKDQAVIGFNMVKGFVKGYDVGTVVLDKNGEPFITRDGNEKMTYLFRNRWHDIYYDETDSFIKVLAADADKLDGYNCYVGIVDEYHSAPNSQVRDVIRSSQGMRVNPLLITITTAGFDKSLPCYDLHTVATEIIAGIKQDDSFFSVIYSLDEGDDWKDESVWIKANPNLDVTVSKDFIRKQVLQAINNPGDEV
jgi:phage terminase large subunit-like protein